MTRPGVEIGLVEISTAAITAPTDTGVWFVTGLSERGATTPQPVLSLDDFVTKFGGRQSYSILYDCVQAFFREGGYKAYVSRVVGPGATSGTKQLLDASSGVSLVATALGPGAWSANYKIAVVAGSVTGTYAIHITDLGNNIIEDSGNLLSQDDAVAWGNTSNFIRLTLGASTLVPNVAAGAALSAGTDDRNNITDVHWGNALNQFSDELGPGQVSQPGRTGTTAHDQLIDHAEQRNRVALLDLPDSYAVATLVAAAGSSRFAAAFAPWYIIPGLTAGTIRTVPPSPIIAGMLGRNDPALGANAPAAGKNGITRYATGLSQIPWVDSDRETLNVSGVNVIRTLYGAIMVYGWRSTTDPITDSNWIDFGNARLFVALSAELNLIGQNFLFDEIDGQNGRTIGSFHDALAGALLKHWNQGELFGDAAEESFVVDTGPSVNTLQTIANLELRAVCYVKMAPFAELIPISIVKRPITAL